MKGSLKMPTNSRGSGKKVASIKHMDKRANIPTEELRDFVSDDEKNPKNVICLNKLNL